MSLLGLLVVLCIVAVLFGGYGYRREPSWGYVGFSPFAIIVLLLLLYAVGVIH
jgi:hypothetical protein